MSSLRLRASSFPFLVAFAVGCGGAEPVTASAPADGATTSGDAGSGGAGAGGGSTSTVAGPATSGAGGSGGEAVPVPYPDPDWPVGVPEDHGLDGAALNHAADLAADDDSYCMLVIRHGVILSEHYWNGRDAQSADKSWSIAKSYSSALVGIALDRGDIEGLDQKVADYVPEWQYGERSAITIRDLLSMTSGLAWSAFQDYVAMATLAYDHTDFATGLSSDVAPGTEWTYHNGGVQMLEPVLRAATGVTMEEYADEHLWSKIGSNATWGHDPSGNDTAYANVLASCRDHARLGYLYLHGGQWAGEQVLPASWVAQTITPSQDMNRAYGFLWWLNGQTPAMDAMMEPWPGPMVPFAPPDLFAARGFGNQFIDVIPSLDLMVIRFGADPAGNFDIAGMIEDQRFEKHDAILAAVLEAVTDGG